MCTNIKDSGTVERLGSSRDAKSLVDSLYFPAISEAGDLIQHIRRARCEPGCVGGAFVSDLQPKLALTFNWRTRQFDGKATVAWSAERQCDPAPPPPPPPIEEPEEPDPDPPIDDPPHDQPDDPEEPEEPEEPEPPPLCGAACVCGGLQCSVRHVHCPSAKYEPLGCIGVCDHPPNHGGAHHCSKHNHAF